MKATITYNTAQTIESVNSTTATVTNWMKGLVIIAALLGVVKFSQIHYNNVNTTDLVLSSTISGVPAGSDILEVTLPEIVITPNPAVNEMSFEYTLPEVVITANRPIAQEMVYEYTLPEVVITASAIQPVTTIIEHTLPEVIITGKSTTNRNIDLIANLH